MTEIPNGLALIQDPQLNAPTPVAPTAAVPRGLTTFTPPTNTPAGLTVVGVPDGPLPEVSPEQDTAVDTSSVGRVLDAFGEGMSDGWGAEPLGLSPETDNALREFGVFNDINDAHGNVLKTFNRALMRPLAAGIDTVLRTGNAAIFGVARGAGEAMDVSGLSDVVGLPGSRLTRDIVAMTDVVGIATATHPFGPRRARKVRADASRQERATINSFTAVGDDVPPVVETARVPPTKPGPVVDKAGNINLNRINSGDDVKDVIREASVAGDEFTGARRGVMSLEETADLADAMGMTADELVTRKVGAAFNAEEAVAARNLLVQSADDVRNLSVKASGGTDADVLAFQEAMTRHMAIQEQVAGMTAEAGRALSSFRIAAQANKEAKALGDMLNNMGGRAPIEDIARRVADFDDPHQLSKFLGEARQATTSDMVLEAWINGLLSGPTTHVTNILSNTLTAFLAVPERGIAAGISAARGQTGMDRVRFGEVGQKLFGFAQGAQDGVRAGWRAYKTEMPTNRAEKLEVAKHKAIPSKKITVAGKEIELGGKQVRIPGRLLTASDEFFKAIGYRQELNALAYRKAASEGLSGQAFKNRLAEIVANPTLDMRKAATGTAEYQTFTKPLGEMGQSVQKFANAHPTMKIPFTFIRTPVNIVKYAGERTILSVLSKEVRASLKGKKGGAESSEQFAKLVMGGAVATAAWSIAQSGGLTGAGPTDQRQRAMMYMTGWQPYSVQIGDMYYSYARLEPFGMLFGITADMHEISDKLSDAEMSEIAALISGSVSKNLVSKTWLKGPSDLIEAFNDPDRYGASYIRKLAGTVVPTGVAQATRADDPFLREARTIIDTVKSRIPGLSTALLPRRDAWGDPIELEGAAGPDLLSPIYQSKMENDPVNQELLSLGVFPSRLKREIRGVELTDLQYDDYQKIAGKLAKTTLDQMVAIEGWRSIPEFRRSEIVSKTVTDSRAKARKYMIMKHPDILRQYGELRTKELGG